MLKRFFSAILCILFLLSAVGVLAAPSGGEMEAIFDGESSSVHITGRLGECARIAAVLNIALYDENFQGFTETNMPLLSCMVLTKDGGVIDENVAFPADSFGSGEYTAYLNSPAGKTSADFLLYSANDENTLGVFSEMNTQTDAEKLSSFLSTDRKIESIGFYFDETSKYMDDIASLCIRYRGKEGYTLGSLNKMITYVLAISQIKENDEVDTYMRKYAAAFATDYNTYASLEPEIKSELDSILAEHNPQKIDNALKFSELSLVAKARNAAKNWSTLRDFAADNADALKINCGNDSKYMKIPSASRYSVFSEIAQSVRKCFTSAEITKLFNDSVDSVYDEGQKNSGQDKPRKSSSGGGGGGAGSYIEAERPVKEPVTDTVISYSDLEGHFSKEAVEFLSAKDIINGYENNEFKPDAFITRSEFSKLIACAFDIASTEYESGFTDVKSTDWFCSVVTALASQDIIKGDGNRFYPSAYITRQDAAVILSRVLKGLSINLSGKKEFEDNEDVSEYAKDGVTAMAGAGIIQGSNNRFLPTHNITRGETAVMLYRAFLKWREAAL